jgi:hypothetical protein
MGHLRLSPEAGQRRSNRGGQDGTFFVPFLDFLESFLVRTRLLQLRVLGLRLLRDGDFGVGIFPEGEEILLGSAGFGGVALQRVGTP